MILKKKSFWQGMAASSILALAISIGASAVLEANKTAIDLQLGTQSTILKSEDGDGLYTAFQPNDKFVNKDANGKITSYNTKEFLKSEIQIGRKAAAEGSVLLKNDNATLPLSSGSNVTLLGKRSHTPLLGSGMGVDPVGQIITLETALSGTKTDFTKEVVSGNYSTLDNYDFKDLNIEGRTDGAGAGFKINQAMVEKYESLKSKYSATYKDRPANYNVNEVPASEIADVNISSYKDAAIVVLGRPSAESGDFARPAAGKDSILAPTAEELGIVDYATKNFNKVVLIINTNSPMEIDAFKNNSKVGAILWVGHPGNFGTLGVADILCGRVSPSGGLADTYAVHTMSTPAAVNFGNYTYSNYDNKVVTRSNSSHYCIEAEGIYTGYKYYETRYYDAVMNQGNAKGNSGVTTGGTSWNYSSEISYPFGYGMSYTTFDMALNGTPKHEQKGHEFYTTVSVKVTNKGNVPGSTPVQIYVQAPYIKGGVEKSAVQLVEFGKTHLLQPGQSEVVNVEVDWQNIASYDMEFANADGSKGSYILDKGDYYFTVGNGAHEAINNILAAQGKNKASGMDADGNKNLVYKYTYTPANGTNVDGDTFGYSKNGTKIKNQIPYSDWNYYEKGKVTYLSRADWVATYPKEYSDMAYPDSMINDLNGKYYTIKTNDDVSDIKWGDSSVQYNFYDLAKMPYDDPRWDEVLNKMTLEDAITMSAYGGNTFAAAQSVGFGGGKLTENTGNGIQTYTPGTSLLGEDCPWIVTKEDNNNNMSLKVFGSAVLLASTFSHELLFEQGTFMGEQAILIGLPILWGPGGNTHRSPYNGRTGEYYSEDAVLTGVGCMEFAVGARDKGLIAAPKHYAFNDQETNRNGIAPFLTEQRARETELRAFQIAFESTKYDRERGEDTGMLGMMTSFSKIGAVECTSSVGLVKNIAVGEWGFRGYCVTDINDDFDIYSCMVMGGCTGYDNRMIGNPSWDVLTASNSRIKDANATAVTGSNLLSKEAYAKDREFQLALKDSCHRTLYTFCQSVLMNQYNSSTKMIEVMTSWRIAYVAAISLFAVLTAASVAMYGVTTFLTKKEEN